METVNLFGAQRGRAAQAAAWAMEKERFSTQEMANALAVSTPTAITLLRRLEEKGAVRTVELSRAKVYYPAIEREDAAMSETTDLIDRVYRGSLSQLVSTFTKKQALPKEEIDELYAMLKRMEGEINA